MRVQAFLDWKEIDVISVWMVFAADDYVPCCGQSRNTRGVQLSQKHSPTRLPTNYPPRLAPGTKVPPLVRTGALNWEGPNYLCSAEASEIVSCRREKLAGQVPCPLAQVATVDCKAV